MKTLSSVLSMCLLFTNCYSYRAVDLADERPIVGQKYKIKVMDEKTTRKVIIMVVNEPVVTFLHRDEEIQIAYSQIRDMRERKFSWVKTIGLPVVTVFVVGMGGLLFGGFPLDINLDLQLPN